MSAGLAGRMSAGGRMPAGRDGLVVRQMSDTCIQNNLYHNYMYTVVVYVAHRELDEC